MDYTILKNKLNEGRDFLKYYKDNFEDDFNSIWKFSEHNNLPNLGTRCQMTKIMEDWITRLAPIKGNAIASIGLFGTPGDFSISGIIICRGLTCAIDRVPDLPNPREDFMKWEELEFDDEATEKLIENYFTKWPGDFSEGNKPFILSRDFM